MTKGLSVIIAEEISVCLLLRNLCMSRGLHIIAETQSGIDLVSLVREHQPDIIVLDIELNGISGIEATMQLRNELEYFPEIIFVTRSLDPIHIMTAVNEINGFYIVKPLLEEQWNIAISKILEPHHKQEWYSKQTIESNQLIEIRTSRRSYPVAEETILLIEKEIGCKNVNIYLTSGEVILSNNTLNQIMQQSSDLMVLTIRGYLVNIRHVAGYRREMNSSDLMHRKYTIFFRNSTITAPLGRLQEKDFSMMLNRYKRGITVV